MITHNKSFIEIKTNIKSFEINKIRSNKMLNTQIVTMLFFMS